MSQFWETCSSCIQQDLPLQLACFIVRGGGAARLDVGRGSLTSMEILQKNLTNNSFDPPLFLHSIVNFRTSFFDYIYIYTHTYTYKHETRIHTNICDP